MIAAVSMATPTLVPAAWAKGKYDVYRLSRDGSFSGYMHPPGLAYLVNLDVNAHTDVDQVFVSARNQQAKGKWFICAASTVRFASHLPNSKIV